MKSADQERPKHTIPAVCKAMELLGVLAEEQGETTTKALALRLGVPRTTCYRLLRSLISRDWVRPLPGGGHAISIGLLPLLQPLREVEGLAEAVQPVLDALALRSSLTAKVSVRQGDYAITVARCESPQATSIAVRVGASFHLALGSSGTVLLSGLSRQEMEEVLRRAPEECWTHQARADVHRRLEELQNQGWCADQGSFRPSCHAVSTPLRDPRGKILAAMTIIGFPQDLSGKKVASSARLLVEAARQAERRLRQPESQQSVPGKAEAGGR
ncbi:MAG: helix-turn-helix domain-containing protein [Thermoguttaceae bacterium]|nr:helix-turn-helix domain-containing protein [Thermoguttaceae bacterium]